ncbi:MAG: aldo/keto reductase [Prevotella sp.]|nr:aldo/keto reductase [Prevotella sp.]
MSTNTFQLANGVEMPMLGLGTWPMTDKQLHKAVLSAFNVGYRLIDTADNYYNEEDLGMGLQLLYKATDAKRKDMFLVSKLSDERYDRNTIGGGLYMGLYFWKTSPVMQKPNAVHDVVRMRINSSLKKLQTDYIDLYLMHWPYPDFFQEIWYEMEQLVKEGKVRAIGVCNCRERHLEMLRGCSVPPHVNQFETSPLNTKVSHVNYCKEHGVQIMVYSPLMSLRQEQQVEYQDYLVRLSHKYKRDKAQIVLRFNLQRGFISIPKSSHRERLASNISIFDFKLSDEEMQTLLSFNADMQYLPESKYCPGI